MSIYRIQGPWAGLLAIVSRPRGGDWLDDEVLAWKNAGLDVIVSLLTKEEDNELDLTDEERACEKFGLRFFQFPIADVSIPTSREAAFELVNELERLLARGRGVGIHCRQSVGRSGIIAACILILSGSAPEEALENVSNARGVIVPQTDEQREWVIGFAREFAPAATR